MSAQASPSLAGWNGHGPVAFAPSAGCSHQPPVQITSSRPSPLTSPTPRPCENCIVPGIGFPGANASLMGCLVHGWVGSAPGANHDICPSLPPGFSLGCQPMTSTRSPEPNKSTYCGVSLQALCQISCSVQRPAPPLGFSYQ